VTMKGLVSKHKMLTPRFLGSSDLHLEALASLFNWSIPNFHQVLGDQLVLS
jgi:hypothetical protein